MSETILRYNGIELRNCQTLGVEEIPVKDESGQAWIYTQINLRVLGYITKDNRSSKYIGAMPNFSDAGHYDPGESFPQGQIYPGASQQMAILRTYLLEKRRHLEYNTTYRTENSLEEFTLYNVRPAPEGMWDDARGSLESVDANHDVHGGPDPQTCNITQVASNNTFRVEFSIKFCLSPTCMKNKSGEPLQNPNDEDEAWDATQNIDEQLGQRPLFFDGFHKPLGILSNRFSCQDRINDNWYTTRTYNGVVKLSNPSWNPHDYRAVTLPPVTPGMRRKSIDYKASPDGLTLSYSIVDEEVTITPPEFCTNLKIVHTETQVDFGHLVNFTLRVELAGAKNGSLYDLNRIATAIIEGRLNITLAAFGGEQGFTLLVDSYETTTQQGSTQEFGLTSVVSGRRIPVENNNGDAQGHLDAMTSAMLSRQVAVPNTIIENYNNNRSKGNRTGEQPEYEGYIPALSALHSVVPKRCTDKLHVGESIGERYDIDDREDRIEAMQSVIDDYDYSEIYWYKPEILASVSDIIPDNPDVSFNESHDKNIYTEYNIHSIYRTMGLILNLPSAYQEELGQSQSQSRSRNWGQTSGGARVAPDSVSVRIGPPQRERVITVEAQRVGSPPRMPPAPQMFTETAYNSESIPGYGDQVIFHLKDEQILPQAPQRLVDGSGYLYTMHAQWTYSIDRAPAAVRLGVPDFEGAANQPSGSTQLTPFNVPIETLFSGDWSPDK